MSDLAERLVSEEEGREACAYQDNTPQQYWTIGIGCLVDKRVVGAGLCDEAISAQFAHDSAEARRLASRFPGFDRCNEVRQAVLISMCFQMGSKPLRWPNFCHALEMGDYEAARRHGLDSDWARIQTPKRAQRQMNMLASGEWESK